MLFIKLIINFKYRGIFGILPKLFKKNENSKKKIQKKKLVWVNFENFPDFIPKKNLYNNKYIDLIIKNYLKNNFYIYI